LLLSPEGFPHLVTRAHALIGAAQRAPAAQLALLMKLCEEWAQQLVPAMSFDEFIDKMMKIDSHPALQSFREEMRRPQQQPPPSPPAAARVEKKPRSPLKALAASSHQSAAQHPLDSESPAAGPNKRVVDSEVMRKVEERRRQAIERKRASSASQPVPPSLDAAPSSPKSSKPPASPPKKVKENVESLFDLLDDI